MTLKHLSSLANDVVQRCALKLSSSMEELVEEFEGRRKGETGSYSRAFMEFCCSKAMADICENIECEIKDGSFSRFTFDMMVAWEEDDCSSFTESAWKGGEDVKLHAKIDSEQDDISLFYSDLMPLLVNNEANVGEDAFVWLGTLCPLLADVVNGRFTFEILTAPTAYRLHFPAYDKFLKEIDRSIKRLQDQTILSGVVLADDEFILHVEGTASTLRVVRHIGATSWPGRLTLTNYALYFEASGVVAYEDAIKIDLSKNIDHTVKPAATGPWGAPLFDKAIVYESSEISERVILEFPEITSSTRRDHWLALTKEIMLLHRFLSKSNVKCPIQAWEMHARTILGIVRLHAARELLRISPPPPEKFLIFALCDKLPKGDYVLEELAGSLNSINSRHPCSANSILRSINSMRESIPGAEVIEKIEKFENREVLSSLETTINQAREEEREMSTAKATTEALKEEGITESALVLVHSNTVMVALILTAIVLAVVPTKFIIMAVVLYGFAAASKLGKYMVNERVNRRLKEWWDSIPIIHVKVCNTST